MHVRHLLPLFALAACDSDTQVVPLDELQASFYLRPFSTTLPATAVFAVGLDSPLPPVGEPCPVLPEGSTFKLDGVEGEVELGGAESPHGEVHCIGPNARFTNIQPHAGTSTIEIDDGDTKWTIVIDQPLVARSFRKVTPAGTTLRSGDAVSIQMEPPSGRISDARVYGSTQFTDYFKVDEMTGLVVAGHEMHFTMPTVGNVNTTLSIVADVELAVERCDASLGCHVSGVISSTMPITLAP